MDATDAPVSTTKADRDGQTVTAVALVTDRDKKTASSIPPARPTTVSTQTGRPFPAAICFGHICQLHVDACQRDGRRGASQFCLASRSKQTHSTAPIRSRPLLPISPVQSRVLVTNKEKTSLDGFISHRRAGPHRLGAVLGDARPVKVETMSLVVRCELGHGRGSVCQSWMRPDHLTISPSHHQVTDPVGGFVMACSHSQSLQVPESKRQPCNNWLAQPFGKRVHLSAAIRHGYIQFAYQKTTPWEVEDPSNRQQSRRWQGIRQKRREKRPANPPQMDPHLHVPPLCTFTLSKSRPASCFMLGPVSSCRFQPTADCIRSGTCPDHSLGSILA